MLQGVICRLRAKALHEDVANLKASLIFIGGTLRALCNEHKRIEGSLQTFAQLQLNPPAKVSSLQKHIHQMYKHLWQVQTCSD